MWHLSGIVSLWILFFGLISFASSKKHNILRSPAFPSTSWFGFNKRPKSVLQREETSPLHNALRILSGGDQTDANVSHHETDEERYSRQVYTLGARAHGLVRAATIYLDGPSTSGLVYECSKNLALSGVGQIVILTNDDANTGPEDMYHNKELDDLGRGYEKAARSELGIEVEEEADATDVLVNYLQRLNPSVGVSKMTRSQLKERRDVEGGILVCMDRPKSTQLNLNYVCREKSMPFVALETAGVYGRTFCDFGPSFQVVDSDGETPLVVPLDHVEIVGDKLKVCCLEGEKHDVSKGDEIVFQLGNGSKMANRCTVMEVLNPTTFTARLESTEGIPETDLVNEINDNASCFSRTKIPQKVTFEPLDVASEKCKEDPSLFAFCDLDKSIDTTRNAAILTCFDAMQDFQRSHGRLPSKEDVATFLDTACSISGTLRQDIDESRWKSIVESFGSCCQAKFTPLQAMFGAVGAQEALKAASGLYNPVKQFLLYDCDEVLECRPSSSDEKATEDRIAPGQTYILGKSLTDKLASNRLFVVGAGAIGCELLKNLAAMGAGTSTGCIVLTDMDTIERSNLSRQLLFRDSDIGSFKSIAAQRAVRRFNPNVKVEVHTSKVGDDHGPFNDMFWSEGLDTVLNALDNVEARLHIDGQCVAHRKALVDAGTQGSKGNVQVVVPGKSESYGASADPPEQAIPVCTLKNFPYAISHTIQWGRDMFDELFERRPAQANEYADRFTSSTSDEFAEYLVGKLGEDAAIEAAEELAEDLGMTNDSIDDLRTLRESSIQWAVDLAKTLFCDSIDALIKEHPRDSVDEDGEPFWSGTRRVPQRLSYSRKKETNADQATINKNLVDFVRNAARLRIESFTEVHADRSCVSPEEAASALKIKSWEDVCVEDTKDDSSDAVTRIANIVGSGLLTESRKMQEIEFEKDDETNGHVAFVTAASNLRALCYGIPPVDAMETRRVAGKIVPAMITTTAFVSAQSCIEMIKLLQQAPLKLHRNAFINLALPFFAFTQPLPAEEFPGLRGGVYTLWDRIIVKEGKKSASKGGISLRRFLRQVRKKATSDPDSIVVSNLSYGPYMIYASFLHEDEDDMLDRPFLELLKEAIVSGDEFDDEFSRDDNNSHSVSVDVEGLDDKLFIDTTVVVEEQETGEEVELPPVRFIKHRKK